MTSLISPWGRLLRRTAAFVLLCSSLPLAAQTPPPIKSEPPADDNAWEQERRMHELLHQAETWRGLRAKRRIDSRTLAEKELAGAVVESFHEEMPSGVLRSMEIALKTFGLIPENLDLAVFLPGLLTQEIAGYYDPETKALSLIRREGGVLGGREAEIGLDPQRAEDMVLVHELTHALQDQHFDLTAFTKTAPMSDAATARQALVEGDATLTMMDAFLAVPIEELPGAGKLLQLAMEGSEKWMTGAPDVPGSKELAAAPPYIRETLLFSYVQGNLFCISVRQKGGQKLLDHAFRNDPPRSSEQILHPEKWHGRRDDPVAVEWPDLAGALPGYAKAAEGEMGELAIRILLRESLKDEARAEAAAAGWGGDRFAVYQTGGEKDGRRLLAWITEWDTAEDAAEFAAAMQQLGAGWRTERPATLRVLVLRGEVAPEQAGTLSERLAIAPARPPANQVIDLAALGIGEQDRAGADPEKLRKLLDSPEVQKRFGEMTGNGSPVEKGTIDAEARSYTSPSFSLRLPEAAAAAGWTLRESPSPGVVFMANAADRASWVGFGQQAVPVVTGTIEEIVPLFEAGFSSTLPAYKKLAGQVIDTPNGRAYEGLFEVGSEVRLRGLVRLYQRGSTLIFGTGMAALESWPESEPTLRSILDAVRLAPEP
ncbi:MAG TPA: hypothetical protein VKM72_29695 [Thermoanaerobaculia bacterium]|nr:hypothetical protein [Thermoanaerobaculia bacterium]